MNNSIVKLVNSRNHGGVLTSEVQFIRHWRSQNVQVNVILIGNGDAYSMFPDILENAMRLPDFITRTTGFRFIDLIISFFHRYWYVFQHRDMLRDIRIEGVLIYRNAIYEAIAGRIGLANRCPVYWHMPNSMRSAIEKVYYNISLRLLHVTPIANSIYTRDTIGDICRHVVYPGFDISRTATAPDRLHLRKALGISSDAIVFGIAARLTRRKAQHLVIQAIARIIPKHPNVHLLIAGGPLESNYAQECRSYASQSASNIHFLGHVDDISSFYHAIDIYVNSRLDAEPFGISIAESLGSGKPVIAFRSGGPEEMIKQGINGWLIEKPTMDSYKEAILEALNSRKAYSSMCIAAKQSIGQFEATLNADAFLALIEARSK
jgi:glycosyltransferase involved in cell wall biosynthesis